eukprot:TRINITY_DN112116_c0_g1_i1.p1 TRINITY_DN112116_c0_g1~~TRINITY_DN112116_c0_g1_i1.p1  ORF type:complete len:472 (-),score=111.87 TRINITY_DN112116_c0_g1_i1:118-1338(-)
MSVVAAVAIVSAYPVFAQDAATAVAGAAAGAADSVDPLEVAEDASVKESGDWFEPVVTINASIIALIDNVLEGYLKIPNAFGFAIILYTLFIKVVLFPLNQSSLKNGAMMQLINPKVKQIQAKYKNDQETQNRMLLRLYDDTGVNPLGGCLPSLVQLPLFVGLYRSIQKLAAADERFQNPFLWIPSLSGPVEVGSPNLDWLTKSKYADHFEPLIGWQDAGLYLILPFLLVISQYAIAKYTNPEAGAQGGPAGVIAGIVPLFIGYSAMVSPAGMGVYWLTNNLLTSAQTAYIKNELGEAFPEYRKIIDGTAKKEEKERKQKARELAAARAEDREISFGGRGFAAASKADDDDDEEGNEEEKLASATAKLKMAGKKGVKAGSKYVKMKSEAEYKKEAKQRAKSTRRRR